MRKIYLLLILSLASCSSYYHLSKNEFLQQAKNFQDKSEATTTFATFTTSVMFFFNSTYDANNIDKILCWNDENELVYLFPDQNTRIQISSKSSKKTEVMYFDTVFFKENKIIGLTSRSKNSTYTEITIDDIDDIDDIEIYDRFPKTEKAIFN